MRRFHLLWGALALTLATVVGCAGGQSPTGDSGSLRLNLNVNGTNVTSVQYTISGADFSDIVGTLPVVDNRNPPVWALITGIPAGTNRTITLRAFDGSGNVICEGSATVDVIEGQTVKVTVQLDCGTTPEEPRGDIEIDGDFNIIDQNLCPLVNSTFVLPEGIAAGGDADVQIVAVDPNGDPLTFSWTATSGSFADPSAASTTYTCDANGPQTLTVVVSDGDASCDLSVQLSVVCGSVGNCQSDTDCDDGDACTTDTCTGGVCLTPVPVTCPDDGNECTSESCDPQSGCVSAPVPSGTACNGGNGSCNGAGSCVPNNCTGANMDCDGNPANGCETNTGNDVNNCGGCGNVCQQAHGVCQSDACQGGACTLVPNNGVLCDDGNACTVSDICTGGSCLGQGVTCPDDGNECTTESCDPQSGCGSEDVAAGTPCNGGAGACDGAGACVANPVCGNGVIETGEQCDDGNSVSGDGCSATCQQENGWTEPSQCATTCGDGVVAGNEQCDDGNNVSGDGCREDCTAEVCGDGILDLAAGEHCDDGNTVGGDGCSATCQAESGYVGVDACFNDSIPLFPVGDDCRARTLRLMQTQTVRLDVTGAPVGQTLLARGKINQGSFTITQTGTIPIAGSGSTDTVTLPAGDYQIQVCDVTGAGYGSFQACIRPERFMTVGSCHSGTVTDGDGDDVDLAGPISGGDEDIRIQPTTSQNIKITLTNHSGGAIMRAALYTGQPGSEISGSRTGLALIGQTKSGGAVAVTAGTSYWVYVDVASAGAIGNYTVCVDPAP